MNYTISTEPVTEEHIGRRVLVRDDVNEPFEGPFILFDIEADEFPPTGKVYWVTDVFRRGTISGGFEVLLIVES